MHDVVARSAFPSQHVQNTPCSDMFGPLLEVEMSKKCTPLWREARFQVESAKKLTGSDMFGPLLEVEMSKKCTPLWRDSISQSKCTKHSMLGPLLEVEDVQKAHPSVVARSAFPSGKCKSPTGSEQFWTFRCHCA